MASPKPKHEPCPCGCGEMADECMTGRNPLGAFTIEPPIGSPQIDYVRTESDD